MTQNIIIGLPLLAALIVCLGWGPEIAFLNVYLPSLLLLPQYYLWTWSGQYSFSDTAILPIAVFFLLQPKQSRQWNSIDYLVIAYVAITTFAEGMNKGYKLGTQNLFVHELGSIIFPYYSAKLIFERPELAIALAKRIALLLTVVAVISVYEFRMGRDLFTHFFEGIFPPNEGTVVFRAGFMRTQGPFGHAIALGVMMAVGFRIARWLEWRGAWSERFVAFLPLSKIRICELGIIAGSIMSLSVGPWLGAVCGSLSVAVCRAQQRGRALAALVLIIVVVGLPGYSSFQSYVSVDAAVARATGDRLQEDSIYRHKLIPLYVPIVEEKPAWGWGRNGFPVLEGMVSIDNGYLLTALTFGLCALGLILVFFLWAPLRLSLFGLPLPRSDPRTLETYTLIGIFIMLAVTNATASVTAGTTEWRFFFLVAGWTATLLNAPAPAAAKVGAARDRPLPQFGFRRVMV